MKGMKSGVLRKRFWLTLGFVAMLTIMAAGQLFAAELTEAEKEWLFHIRLEEKVARDVYKALYDKWQLPIFNKIAASEQTHMDAIETLLDRYGLDDPAEGLIPGDFINEEFPVSYQDMFVYFQNMYDDLIESGSISVTDALNVGITIEVTDIADLEEGLAIKPLHKDIQRVYQNLMAGSENHLAAFESVLSNY